MSETNIENIPSISYAELGRALLWKVEEEEVEWDSDTTTYVVSLRHRDAPTSIQIDRLGAIRFEKGESVEVVDSKDHEKIAAWIAAGFHLSLSLTQLGRARQKVDAELAVAE